MTRSTPTMLKALQKFGLTDKEAKVYLANLELGPAKIPELAQKSKIKRTTVYVIIDVLIKKGLVSYYQSKHTKRYVAEEPKRLKSLLKEKDEALDQIMPQLQALVKKEKEVRPEIRFYQGKAGCLTIIEQTLESPNSEVLFLGSIKDIYKIVSKDYDYNHYIPTRLKKNIKFTALLFKDKGAEELKAKEKNKLRQVRYLPDKFYFESSMLVFQDKIAMISSERELIGVVIQSKDLAKMEEMKFKMLWDKM